MKIMNMLAMALFFNSFTDHAQGAVVGIGSTSQGSAAYTAASAIARVVSENSSHRMRVVPQGGPETTLPMVNSGALEFSVSNSVDVIYAVRGEEIFEGRRHKRLKVVAVLFPLNVGYFVQRDSAIKSIADLAGKRIPVGFGRQKGLALISRAILATEGLGEKDVNAVLSPSGLRSVQDFITGRLDAAVFSVGSGAVAEAHANAGGIRFISISDASETLQTIRTVTPGAFITTLMPAPNLPGIVEKTHIWMTPFILLASEHTSDELVYDVTRLLHGNAKSLVSSAAVLKAFDPMNMRVELEYLEYHPGALKFYAKNKEP